MRPTKTYPRKTRFIPSCLRQPCYPLSKSLHVALIEVNIILSIILAHWLDEWDFSYASIPVSVLNPGGDIKVSKAVHARRMT